MISPETQHYILKNSMFPDQLDPSFDSAVFATGCFWGSEKSFWRMPGVQSTAVGYIAGTTENPSYEAVCTGNTGHTEAVLVIWDPAVVSFGDLLRNHMQSHDPTQVRLMDCMYGCLHYEY